MIRSLRRAIAFLSLFGGALCPQSAIAERVEITGVSALAEPKLRAVIAEQLQDIETRGLTPARADDAAFYLASHYRKEGYSRAAVDYEIRGGKVILKISEGPRTLVRSLKFSGNRSIASDILAPFFAGVKIEGVADAKLPYRASDVTAGSDRVRGYYESEGWLDAAVTASGTRITADGTAADIAVAVVEGGRYVFGPLTITGTTPYSRAELIEALGAKAEGPFNPSLVDAMQGALRSWLRARGHFAADVFATADRLFAKEHAIPVNVEIRVGPKFRVGGVVSRGLDRVKPEFIQQRFRKATDGSYDPALIDEKYRELLRTGLFRTMRVSPVKTGPDTLNLELEVEEAKQKHFGFEVGYGSYEGVVAVVQGGDRNFLRTGRPLTVELRSSLRGFEGEILHVDPWFLDSEWSLRTRLSSKFRDEDGYTRKGVGVRLDATRKLTPRLEISAFTEFATTSITANGIDPTLLGPLDYTLTSIGVAQKLDHRDDPLNPRRGYVFSTSLELDALDGQLAFGRALFRCSHYQSIGRSLLAAGIRAGWIIPVGEAGDIPIDLRYFNGGGGTVRSFSERNLGPKDANGNSLGGAFFTVANLEWDFPLTTSFGGALFADAGNLRSDASPGLEDFRLGLGIGVRYNLPIGPMRLDYGYNPSPREGEEAGAVHFSFGFAF
jgi:outer membrane protein insertion porin family